MCAYRSSLVIGSSEFRMNKHYLNCNSGSPRGSVLHPRPLLPFHASFHGRSAPKFVTPLPPTTLGAPRGGCVDLFRRSSYLSTFVTRLRGSTLISRRFATARSPLFFPFPPSFSFRLFPSFDPAIQRSSMM